MLSIHGCKIRRRVRAALGILSLAMAGAALAYDNGSNDRVWDARELWKEGAGLHLEGDYQGAIERYRRALDLHPTARTHTYLAWSLSRLGHYQDAVDHCRDAIALDASYPNAYNDLGAYLVELGRPGEAIPWLRRAAGLPGYCCAHYSWYQLGRAMLLQARVEEAAEAFRTSLALRPRYHPARHLLHRIRTRGLKGL